MTTSLGNLSHCLSHIRPHIHMPMHTQATHACIPVAVGANGLTEYTPTDHTYPAPEGLPFRLTGLASSFLTIFLTISCFCFCFCFGEFVIVCLCAFSLGVLGHH